MNRSPRRGALIGLGATLVILLVVGFSPLVNADTGWRNTLGGIVWWAIIAVTATLVVLVVVDLVHRRRRPARS